jgi:hypothetical protein
MKRPVLPLLATFLFLFSVVAIYDVQALDNGVALIPPMVPTITPLTSEDKSPSPPGGWGARQWWSAPAAAALLSFVGVVVVCPLPFPSPPTLQGWSTWNTLACDYDEEDLRVIADIMVKTGLTKLGYVYFNIDDCWEDGRDASGRIRFNATQFPSGMHGWGKYLHNLGMKFGIYTSSGPRYSTPPSLPCT